MNQGGNNHDTTFPYLHLSLFDTHNAGSFSMTSSIYFSYGSNMSSRRLKNRVPGVRFIGPARLVEHQLRFHKIGKDGSGKCDIEHTQNPGHLVWGVIVTLSESEKRILDRIEGLGYGYGEKVVSISLENGEQLEATTYYAIQKDASIKPYHWYKEHVLAGAREHHLPSDYISAIESIESIADPDRERHENELSIYREFQPFSEAG